MKLQEISLIISWTTRKLLMFFVVAFFTSCSFNSLFLHPTKLPKDATTLRSASDSTIVTFSGVNFQPTFARNGKDTNDFDFKIESVIFQNLKGNKLNGWMIKSRSGKPSITLLHFHGNAGFLISQYQRITPLIKQGFQIFMFDYGGFGFSEGKATRENVLLDANAALTYLKNRDVIKNTKVVIYGQSLGGHLAAVVATQRQNEIDGLVIEGAFSSHKDVAAKKAGLPGRLFVSEKYSAYKVIAKFRKPLLVIHSTEDKVVPFELGRKLFDKANTSKKFLEIKECHICGPQFYADTISASIKDLLK